MVFKDNVFCMVNKSYPIAGPVAKLKNLSNVHSILLGVVENDFQLVIQKESYESAGYI